MIFSFKNSKYRGFTLIELMITVAIFVFMTALIMAKYNSFYSGTIFNNIAYDVALTIKQAQTYGISVKATDNNFASAYGVRFTNNSKEFLLYPYTKSGFLFNVGTLEKKYTLKQGAKFSSLKLVNATSDYTLTNQDSFDIIFQRPNPEAIICVRKGIQPLDCNSYKKAEIKLLAIDGETNRTITINSVGQIVVQ